MMKKTTSQKAHLEAAEAQHQKHQKPQRHQRNQDLLEDQNHPKRRNLKIKPGLPSWQQKQSCKSKSK